MKDGLKTTRPVRVVRTIADIEAIESLPYDHWVTAHNLLDLLRATALHGAQRPALTVLRSPDPDDVGGHWTHGQLLTEVQRAANLFRVLGLGPEGGVAAFLMPTLPELPALLLGAQVAGVAGSLNYLLKPDAIADLLNAMHATVLVVPARALDPACWEAARAVLDRVPTTSRRWTASMWPCSCERTTAPASRSSPRPAARRCARCFIPAGRPADPNWCA